MRRLLVITLLLIAFTASAQDEIIRFKIDGVQISPDGKTAVFRIVPNSGFWELLWFTPPGELFRIDLESGRVSALALQLEGPEKCLRMNYNEYGSCQEIYYGIPAFTPDGKFIAWHEVYDDITDSEVIFERQLAFRAINSATNRYIEITSDIVTGTLVPAVMQAHGSVLFSVVDKYKDGKVLRQQAQVYDFEQETYIVIEVLPENSGDNYETMSRHWVWANDSSYSVLLGAGYDDLWRVFDPIGGHVTTTHLSPIAEIRQETLHYIYATSEFGWLSWQVAVADPTLSSGQAILRARQLMNAGLGEFVRAALEAALIAEFSQTGFSLHPGMTAVFDEFQIYDVLGVEREDTLLVPLEWRLAQPPEGESRPLDIHGPEEFPGAG
jgi:hypothetical protein